MSLKSILLALLVPFTWGLGVTYAKAGLAEFPPLLLMGLRFTLAALILVWFVPVPRGFMMRIFWIALISATVQYGLTFTGLTYIDASLAVIVVQLEVPFAILLAVIFFGERLNLQRVTGLLLAFGGVALIAGRPAHQDHLWPIFLVMAGALTWAVGQMMVKGLGGRVGGFALTAWVGVFAGPQMLLASTLLEGNPLVSLENATWLGWSSVLYLAVVMTVIGYGAWYHVLAHNPVNKVAPFLLLLPVTTVLGSMLFLGERPGPMVLMGGAIVIAGVALVIRAPERAAASKSP